MQINPFDVRYDSPDIFWRSHGNDSLPLLECLMAETKEHPIAHLPGYQDRLMRQSRRLAKDRHADIDKIIDAVSEDPNLLHMLLIEEIPKDISSRLENSLPFSAV